MRHTHLFLSVLLVGLVTGTSAFEVTIRPGPQGTMPLGGCVGSPFRQLRWCPCGPRHE